MEDIIKLSLEDYKSFVNDDDPELAIAKALFISTRPNSHGFHLSENVLKKYAPTILGKFLIGNLNIFETDVMSHERKPDIFGYIPDNQTIEFKRAEDGYLDAYVNIVVSKIYATEVYNLFLEENFRNVSVEMRVMYENEETKEVAEFHIAGLTVLGKDVSPSVPQAHMQMVKFSAEQANEFYCKMANSHNNFETEVLGKLNLVLDKLNQSETVNNVTNTEEVMAKLEEKEKDVVMEKPTEESKEENKKEKLAESEEETKDKAEEKTEDEKSSDELCAKSEEEKKVEDEKSSDESDKSDDEDDKSNKDEEDEEDDKLAKTEARCSELETKCAELEKELSELQKFKADTEEKEKMSIVNQTLAQVKESMDSKEYAKFEAKAKDCTLETVNAWHNEVLANVATVLIAKKDESHLRMGVEEISAPKGLWDRM